MPALFYKEVIKVKIRILKSLAGLNFSYSAGQEAEIDDKIAMHWIKVGLAEPVGGDMNGIEADNSPNNGADNSPGSKKSSSSRRNR